MKENDGVYMRPRLDTYCVVRDGSCVIHGDDRWIFKRFSFGVQPLEDQYSLDKLVLPMEFFE